VRRKRIGGKPADVHEDVEKVPRELAAAVPHERLVAVAHAAVVHDQH